MRSWPRILCWRSRLCWIDATPASGLKLMSHRVGCMLRNAFAGLLVLSLLVMSVGRAHASGLIVPHKAAHYVASFLAADHDHEGQPAGHEHSGSPCKDGNGPYGLPCCVSGGCPMLSAWLPVALPIRTPARSVAPIYWALSTPCRENMAHAPPLGPPRENV